MSLLSPRRFGGLCALLMVALAIACGSRTPLRGGSPCGIEGETLACVGVCGTGTTECVDGFWSECFIPRTTAACEDVCGQGTMQCDNERWSECVVPPTVESCENNCGTGTRTCEERVWSECEVEKVTRSCTFGCGEGSESCEDDKWSACDAPRPLPPILTATVRDFSASHPDFEGDIAGVDYGIVEERLGPDDKPVYQGGTAGTTTGKAEFDQWYRDVPGVNESTSVDLRLTVSNFDDAFYIYEDRTFFPIDNILLGNEGYEHNFHFTLEAQASFIYQEGQVFRFDGDDDIFVFINGWIVIDIGGLHESMSAEVSLDEEASRIGLIPGEEYSLHIFFAERHTVASNFVIETSIAGLGECPAQ